MNLTQHLNADPAAPRWLVALSGGMDSIVLLHSLASLVSQSSGLPPVSAIHVNHQLHPEADAWQAHCDRVCASLGVPLQHSVVSVDGAGEGIEAAARRARYAVFEDSLGEGDVLFMAHHQDDQVETLLLRLLRGAGLSGLGGMPERRPLGAGQLYRPFLGLPRSMLADYAAEQKLDWVDDPSNADSQFDRNYLRAQVIPAVAQRWPGYRQTISRAAANLAEAQALLTQLAPSPLTLRSRTGDPGLAARDLPADDPVRAVHNLRAWLQDQGVMAPEHRMLPEFLRQLHTGSAAPEAIIGTWGLRGYRGDVFLVSGSSPSERAVTLAPGEQVAFGNGHLSLEPVTGDGYRLAPEQRVEVHVRTGGERCQLAGREHRTVLKKYLQQEAIPPWHRDAVPLVYLGGVLIDIGGFALCEHPARGCDEGDAAVGLWRLRWRAVEGADFVE